MGGRRTAPHTPPTLGDATAEPGRPSRLGRALPRYRPLADGEVEAAALAPHQEQGRRAGRVLPERAPHLLDVLHRLTIDGHDDIPGADTGIGGRAVLTDIADDDAMRLLQAQIARHVRSDVLDGESERPPAVVSGHAGRWWRLLL